MLPSPVLNMKASCLSKTWMLMYQIRSMISQKTMIWICIYRWNLTSKENLGYITRKK
jgi:hypothetical protein